MVGICQRMHSDIYLREDAPEEVKKYYEKLRREDSMFD